MLLQTLRHGRAGITAQLDDAGWLALQATRTGIRSLNRHHSGDEAVANNLAVSRSELVYCVRASDGHWGCWAICVAGQTTLIGTEGA